MEAINSLGTAVRELQEGLPVRGSYRTNDRRRSYSCEQRDQKDHEPGVKQVQVWRVVPQEFAPLQLGQGNCPHDPGNATDRWQHVFSGWFRRNLYRSPGASTGSGRVHALQGQGREDTLMAGRVIELIFLIGLITTIVIVLAPLVWVSMIAIEKIDKIRDNK